MEKPVTALLVAFRVLIDKSKQSGYPNADLSNAREHVARIIDGVSATVEKLGVSFERNASLIAGISPYLRNPEQRPLLQRASLLGTSGYAFDDDATGALGRTILLGRGDKTIAGELNTAIAKASPDGKRYNAYASVSVHIVRKSKFYFFRFPRAYVFVRVVSKNGERLLDAMGMGDGEVTLTGVRQSAIRKAIDNALTNIADT